MPTHSSQPKEKITLGKGKEKETFQIKPGALKKQLGVPDSYKFDKKELNRLKKVEVGDSFDFNGKKKKMTNLLKKRITLALTLMKGSK
tara:strand:+ start:2241 stop:2504 length:264 start_codon:yes stop_codon:yes gene_type:complete